MIKQLSVIDLAQRLQQPNPPVLIDVREPFEYEIAHVPGTHLHVLNDIGVWSKTLDKSGEYVLICHLGGRSQTACQLLQSMGFSKLANLAGGTDAWAQHVDPGMRRY